MSTTSGRSVIVRRGAELAPAVIDVISEAFAEYPVVRFVLGDDAADPDRRRQLVGLFVTARALRGEPLLVIPDGSGFAAAAAMSFPDGADPPELEAFRGGRWRELGEAARTRYRQCGDAWRPLDLATPHVHLNMIGVRRAFRGQGLARWLLDEAQAISRVTPGSQGVTLTTEDPGNVAIYQRVGYRVTGHARIAPGIETWAMFRPN